MISVCTRIPHKKRKELKNMEVGNISVGFKCVSLHCIHVPTNHKKNHFKKYKDDQNRNPKMNNRDHLVGRPTRLEVVAQFSFSARAGRSKSRPLEIPLLAAAEHNQVSQDGRCQSNDILLQFEQKRE